MKAYKIDSPLFGSLEVPAEDGICEIFEVTMDSRQHNVTLDIFDSFLSNENIATVAGFVENVSKMYQTGKEHLLQTADNSAVIKYFIAYHLEELEEDMTQLFGGGIEAITPTVFIEKLGLRSVIIAPDRSNSIECTIDFSLPEDITDELLAVRFNYRYEITDVSHES